MCCAWCAQLDIVGTCEADKASLNTTVATQASYIKELEMELYAAEREKKCLAKCDANHAKCKNYCSSCHS